MKEKKVGGVGGGHGSSSSKSGHHHSSHSRSFSKKDPLALLREYNLRNKLDNVEFKDSDRVEFRHESGMSKDVFDRKMNTSYRSKKGQGEPYPLDVVIIFLRNASAQRKHYMTEAVKYGVGFVSTLDKQDLLSYLNGRVETVPAIQPTLVAADKIEEVKPLVFDTIPASKNEAAKSGKDTATTPGGVGDFEGVDKKGTDKESAEAIPENSDLLLEKIRGVERNLHDHKSILMCPVQKFEVFLSFASDRLRTFYSKQKQAAAEMNGGGGGGGGGGKSSGKGDAGAGAPGEKGNPSSKPAIKSTRKVRMEYEKEQYSKNRFGEANLNINEYGQAQQGTLDMKKFEDNINKEEEERARQVASMESLKRKKMEEKRSRHQAQEKKRPKKIVRPIVLMSPGFGSILNKFNASEFFDKGKFVRWEEAQKLKPHTSSTKVILRKHLRDKRSFGARSTEVDVKRPIDPERPESGMKSQKEIVYGVEYKVMDQEPKNVNDWDRVCAVIVTGKAWQFKNYRYVKEGNVAELFSRLCGFYFHFSSDPIPKEVEQWNVKCIAIDKNNRHRDVAALREFWTKLDQFWAKKQHPFTM